ncbi:MAG: trypsin-like peptidase domain-containing protein [Alphaproteobacteria bacterium]|nr:trypsin-like peptidase domain-containing protein [Alphaproteobacteria bacterium]
MRRVVVLMLACCLAAPARAETEPPAAKPEPQMSVADLIAGVLPAVVNVSTVLAPRPPMTRTAQDLPAEGSSQPPAVVHGFGSGFIIDGSGIIVTNRHVVEHAIRITVTLQDNTTLRATRIGRLSRADIALLQVKPAGKLPTLKLGDSDQVRVGDKVIAIGNPLGLGGSVSSGIVSGLNRDIRTTPFDDFIQTDAAINHGNSGGPLFDRRGEVIGINTAIYSPTETSGSIGISFALPINDAKFVIDQTLQYGRVRAGWLGLSMQSVTPDIAEAIGLGIPRGSIVAGVEAGGPAAEAGVQEGDVIMSIGTMTPRDSRALWRAIAKAPLGKPIELTVWRDGRVLTVSPTVREMAPFVDPDAPADSAVRTVAAVPFTPGFQLSAITPETRTKYKIAPGQKGVVVTEVAPDSPATERGLVVGDVILRVGSAPVAKPADVTTRIKAARERKEQFMLLLVSGPGGQRFVTLPLHPDG